jgi:hypothetical protein
VAITSFDLQGSVSPHFTARDSMAIPVKLFRRAFALAVATFLFSALG